MQGPSVQFRGVNLNLGNTQILEDISFDIESGSVHCIIGANGGGKTSLIRCMLGQMPHTGDISIEWGENRTTGYVPQHLDFDKTLPVTVVDFITMTCQRRPAFLGLTKSVKTHVDEVMERFGLADKRKYKLGALSGGERQRALFAQAFIPQPSLLVLDEPMTGLDVAGGELLLEVIHNFVKQGGTVVWINHDITQVGKEADRLTYINRTVMLDGKPAEAFQSDAARTLFPSIDFRQPQLSTEGA